MVAILVGICLLAFAPAYTAGITNWDDDVYLRAPFSLTDFVLGNYHPLTMASLAMFGKDETVLHVTNVLLHAACAVLVMVFLKELTGSAFGAFAGALIWAIHPLRVESVVWIAGRKDVLSGVFYVAGLISYLKRSRLTLLFFALALLSKSTAITFPLALLAIDYLQRRRALLEKIPYFALSAIFGAIAYIGIRATPEVALSFPQRIALSGKTLLFYAGKLLLPIRLSAFYPYPKAIAVVAGAGRAVTFAFLFFIGTIVVALPILGIGRTVAADRFTYIPSIALAYLIAVLVQRVPKASIIIFALAIVLGAMTFMRARVWHDSLSLWSSVIESEPGQAFPYFGRGAALAQAGRWREARADLDRSLAIDPCFAPALNNRILVSQRLGDSASVQRDLDMLRRCQR